jgi:hypothetical protein
LRSLASAIIAGARYSISAPRTTAPSIIFNISTPRYSLGTRTTFRLVTGVQATKRLVRLTAAGFRRRPNYATVRIIDRTDRIAAFDCDRLCALAALRRRGANRRAIRRCRTIPTGKCGSSESGSSCDEQGCKKFAFHDESPMRFFRSTASRVRPAPLTSCTLDGAYLFSMPIA